MNLHNSHLRLRIVTEKHLRIAVFLALIAIVWTAIHLTSILCSYGEMIWYVNTIVHHLCLQVLIQLLEVDTLLQRLIRCRIENGINHLVQQRFLIYIAILDDFLQRLLSFVDRILIASQNHRLRHIARTNGDGFQFKG